jgi:hypothetical protein
MCILYKDFGESIYRSMESLENSLRFLAASQGGFLAVYTELQRIMKKEYKELEGLFNPSTGKKKEVLKPSAAPDTEVAPTEEASFMNMRDKKIKIVKTSIIPLTQTEQPVQAEEVVQKMPKGPKEMKQWQKEQEQQKQQELQAAGIVPESLLTRENLEKWIQGENRTYAYIARTYVGCPEAQVATVAKSFQIDSTISKKRAEIIRGKKGRPPTKGMP